MLLVSETAGVSEFGWAGVKDVWCLIWLVTQMAGYLRLAGLVYEMAGV